MSFRGKVQDCFELKGKGLVVMLTEVEGAPAIGTLVDFLGGHRRIVDVGRTSTDGQVVSTRDCLTGRPTAPYCTIGLEWPDGVEAPTDIRGATVQEIKLL